MLELIPAKTPIFRPEVSARHSIKNMSNSQANDRKVLGAGYIKRGELATEQDAIILGLAPGDADKIFICDRDKNLAMFHFKDPQEAPKMPIIKELCISSASEDCLPGGLFASSPSPPPTDSRIDLAASFDSFPEMHVDDAAFSNMQPSQSCAAANSLSPEGEGQARSADHTLVRGWIINIDTGKLVCKSFSEGSVVFVDPPTIETDKCWSGWEFKPYREGTTIRIFWDQEQWRLSTHRKIDASTSRIPGVEIEVSKLFADSCPAFSYDLLSKDVIYVLQIVHRDNQIMNPE
ncbi:MAG: hypothetical protein ABIS18_04785, partial [Actinomycetota bacterium]